MMRPTTLIEFLGHCGTLFASLSLEDDKTKTSKGGVTSPEGRCMPTEIKEVTEMSRERNSALARLEKALQEDGGASRRIFPPINDVERWGKDLRIRGKVRTEDQTTVFYITAVETPLLEIFAALKRDPKCARQLQLDDCAINIRGRERDNTVSGLSHCDRKFLSTKDGQGEEPVFLMEIKPPHKVTRAILERGLLGIRGTDNLKDFIVNCKIRTEDDEASVKELVLTVLTQTYDYMLKAGKHLGCLVTGEAIVFLKIEGVEVKTLCYDLFFPYRDVDNLATSGEKVYCHDKDRKYRLTDVGQLLGLFLVADKSPPARDQARQNVDKAAKWGVTNQDIADHDNFFPESPERPNQASKQDASYRGTGTKRTCSESAANKTRQGSRKDEDDEDGPNKSLKQSGQTFAGTGSQRGNQPQGRGTTRSDKGGKTPADGQQRHSYCSHECLLGLKNGLPLDKKCPNYEHHLHPTGISVENGMGVQKWLLAPSVDVSVADQVSADRMPTEATNIADCNNRIDNKGHNHTSSKGKISCQQQQETYHTISPSTFRSLLRTQLCHTLERGLINTMIAGSRGRIFQLTLLTHGYTLVGKATHSGWIPNLKYEELVYQRLEPLQGSFIPVCLGGLDGWGCFWDIDVGLEWMCLLSWAGLNVFEAKRAKAAPPLTQLIHLRAQILDQIRALGVEHGDINWQNFLGDRNKGKSEQSRVTAPGTLMVCDFERATLSDVEEEKESFPRITSEGKEGTEEGTGK
ncbi:MAG: hypothetical protein OHK93_003323 [Ramalina farinacea]|uniref:Uncharacterized protein n=1 Tax=Ramalina farinacea TaxID=258253 RepID=A0AA43QT10_9LECA|nr:hypothetical protein [Ramalina farinacea]